MVAGVGRKGRIVAIGGAVIGALAADQIIAELGEEVIKLLAILLLSLVIYRGIVKLIEEQQTNVREEDENLSVNGVLLYKYKLVFLA